MRSLWSCHASHKLYLLAKQIAERLSVDLAPVSIEVAYHRFHVLVSVDELNLDDATGILLKARPGDNRDRGKVG